MSEKLSEFLHHWLGQRAEDVEVLGSVAWHSWPLAWSPSDRTLN